MDCEKLTFNILDVHVCAKTGVCCLQLQGDCDPSRWLVDDGHQSLGRQGYIEGEDPGRYRDTWVFGEVMVARWLLENKATENTHTWHKVEMCAWRGWVRPAAASSLRSRRPLGSRGSSASPGPPAPYGSTRAGSPGRSGWTSPSSPHAAHTQSKTAENTGFLCELALTYIRWKWR